MKVVKKIQSVRRLVKAARKRGKIIGLVPTMGALHTGHISLIKAAKKRCDFIVVSIFVNPTQFGPSEDFQRYPRPVKEDLAICRKNGVDVVFMPSTEEMYPERNMTWVDVEKITEGLCGQFRPGHFRGVATVCAKLFNIVGPDFVFFGQKDAQQAAVIKRMAADLNMPLKIAVCPTVREKSGLAISSRNNYLSEKEKAAAACIYKALEKCREMVSDGITDANQLKKQMKEVFYEEPSISIEYICIVDADTLEPLERVGKRALAAIAVHIGATRLIDNIIIDTGK